MYYPYSVDMQNLISYENTHKHEYHYYCIVNTVKRHLYNSYYDHNYAKYSYKTQKLKEKEDKESLKLLSDNPLVCIPINYRFNFPKYLSNKTHLKIIQKLAIINNVYIFKYSIEVFTKRNDKQLIVYLPYFL